MKSDWLEHDPEHWALHEVPDAIHALLVTAMELRPQNGPDVPAIEVQVYRSGLDAQDAARHLQNAVRALRRMRGLD